MKSEYMSSLHFAIMMTFLGEIVHSSRHNSTLLVCNRQGLNFSTDKGVWCETVELDHPGIVLAQVEKGVQNGIVICHPDTTSELFGFFRNARSASHALGHQLKPGRCNLGHGIVPKDVVAYCHPI